MEGKSTQTGMLIYISEFRIVSRVTYNALSNFINLNSFQIYFTPIVSMEIEERIERSIHGVIDINALYCTSGERYTLTWDVMKITEIQILINKMNL